MITHASNDTGHVTTHAGNDTGHVITHASNDTGHVTTHASNDTGPGFEVRVAIIHILMMIVGNL